ncbi:MAG TPA: enoyl-CoA hydratase/isomerase family protein [Casimicrobiaceae bacterium]|nr:enoyl-CoA hydratase/isomerase family protein [Casimicrobiaceae bacterium]
MNSFSDVRVEARNGGIAWITINRPDKHNALSRVVLAKLADAVRSLATDTQTRCILIRGAGDRYFAAGGDLVDLAEVRSESATHEMAEQATAALDAIRECDLPVVAYVNGDALGGGAELAVACDLRMMAPQARIGYVHARLAITPAWGGATDLCQLVGGSRALRMMTRCEMVDASTALQWGLADVVVRDGEQGADANEFLTPIVERPREVLRAIKLQVRAWRNGSSHVYQREVERGNLVAMWLGPEHWAAVDRFRMRKWP